MCIRDRIWLYHLKPVFFIILIVMTLNATQTWVLIIGNIACTGWAVCNRTKHLLSMRRARGGCSNIVSPWYDWLRTHGSWKPEYENASAKRREDMSSTCMPRRGGGCLFGAGSNSVSNQQWCVFHRSVLFSLYTRFKEQSAVFHGLRVPGTYHTLDMWRFIGL